MKIVNRGDERKRTLHFNNKENKTVKELTSEQGMAVKERYHFEVADNNEFEFEY